MSTTTESPLAAVVKRAGPRRSSKLRWISLIALPLLGGIGWFAWSQRAEAAEKPVPYQTEPLSRGDISLTVTATGNLEPTNEVTVGSELSGTALAVYVDTNDRVKKGQELAMLDTTRLQQEIESSRSSVLSAKARVAQAEASLREAEASLKRMIDLRERSGGRLPSQADFLSAEASADRARADVLVAQAAVGETEARLRINEADLDKAVIKSPIDGVILARAIEPGQTVAASFQAPELFVIAENLEHMNLLVTVAEADIGRVAAGQTATFTVDAWPGRTYEAKVLKVAYGSTVVNNVVSYETELEVSNRDLSLRPGMTATVDISVAEARGVFIVPAAALRFSPPTPGAAAAEPERRSFVQSLAPMPSRRMFARSGGGGGQDGGQKPGRARIYILRDGAPVEVPVRTGISDEGRVEVSGEQLSEGMLIITRSL